jgi:hypothetical protein
MQPRAVVLVIKGASGLVVVLAIGASPALAHGVSRHGPKRAFGRGTSTNWSGYAVDGSGATNVVGTWVQPSVLDNCLSGANSWSSPWVGIDGDNSSTVEQIGTDSDCQSGKPVYYAWYEMYPKSLVPIPYTVTPGDTMTGGVTYNSNGSFTLALSDSTAHWSYATTQFSKKPRRSSVEWIMEGPSSGLLTDFGTANFSSASGNFGSQAVTPSGQGITMVSNSGTTRAVPSSASGGSFSVTWNPS